MYWLYNILITVLAPIWVPWMWFRANRRQEKVDWKQRTGVYPISMDPERPHVWFHAVSVGEVVASLPILRELRSVWPEAELLLSVTTSSGHQTAREKAGGLFDHLVYFPIDIPRFTMQAMLKVRPDSVAIMETELWLNFLWAAKAFDSQTLLINGRISDRSFPRSMRLRFFYRSLLSFVDQCLMQSEVDRDRILALGATKAEVFGNCKFDQAAEGQSVDSASIRQDFQIPAEAFVIVIGSTRGEDEEDFVFDALARLSEPVTVIHAPRHIERVPAILANRKNRSLGTAQRSKGETGDYLLLDTYGELDKVYAAADIVIVGGGFGNYGGQNIIQPLAHGKPVMHGPHMQNFRDVAQAAVQAGASLECTNAEQLALEIQRLRQDQAARKRMAESARLLVNDNLGASKRYAEAIKAAGEAPFAERLVRQAKQAERRRRAEANKST